MCGEALESKGMPFREAVVPFIPPIPSSLKLLSELTGEQFALLEREIQGHEAFRRDSRRAEELRIKLDLKDAADALGLLSTARFLYDRAQEWAGPGEDAGETIRHSLFRPTYGKSWGRIQTGLFHAFWR
jgi:hypothetical protein